MFKNVNPRASIDALSPDSDESDDSISVTSTVSGHDPEQEFVVENILAEHRFADGKTYYLVEWAGFQLHESTWEPESNLGDDLKAMWEEDKEKHATGELEPFDVQKFHDARDKSKKEKRERHRRRNRKREKLGLPRTTPFRDEDSSEEEAVEETRIEVAAPEAAPRPPNQEKTTKGIPPASRPAITPATTSGVGGTQPQDGTNRRPSTGRAELQTISSSPTKRQTALPQTTGYPGTARKPSKTSTDALPKPKTRPTLSINTTTAVPSAKPTAGARKNLTAKKSTTQPTGNIFVSGKTRKPRASLKDAMSDSTKTPKLFDRHRHRRLAELGSRGKEDIAPDVSKIPLLDLRTQKPFSRRGSGGSAPSPTQLSPQQENPTPIGPPQTSALVSPGSLVTGADAAPPKKKRKSVRFLEDDEDQSVLVQEPESMDIDSPVIQEPRRLHSPPPRQRPSLDQGRPAQRTQSSDKKLILGKTHVAATFSGLPQEPLNSHVWLEDFLAKETLEFRHTCSANTAAGKLGTLIQEPLASGSLEGGPPLERVAEHLAGGLLALYYGQTEYNILVYSTKCEEWKSIPLSRAPPSPSGAALGYLIFASAGDCKLLLPALISPSTSHPAPGNGKVETTSQNTPSSRGLMMKRLFDFDYNKLLPATPRPLPSHSFFLAIPSSRGQIGQALYHWLRANNPACAIFTSHHEGGWNAFRAKVEYVPGVVIIHETLAWSLRRFPHLSRHLIARNDEYWCISEPIHGLPLYPSISEDMSPPGDIRLTRLFPYRTAIFLTPSFLVSEPRRSLELFEWFTNKWVGSFHYRLVTAHNIHEYLSELAEERYHARQDLWNAPGDIQVDMEANLGGLSRDDCGCRYRVADLAADMNITRTAQAGPFAHDEENSSLVYADSFIDPNDEQSLVNWFGWWATLRADQFRKFHVIGSSQSITLHGCRRGERRVRIPKYTQVTLHDPDAVLEVLQERNDQVEASEAPEGDGNGDISSLQVSPVERKRSEFKKSPRGAFQSNLIRMENPKTFAAYFDNLCLMGGFRVQWILFVFPVYWLDLQMAEYYEDFTCEFSRISDWFKFALPFGACYQRKEGDVNRPARGFNTYLGFFYTIDQEWDPENPPPKKPGERVERHPWLAIYRPVNPHIRPHTRCELIIWDPAARTRYPSGKAPAEKDLIYMQRQLIQHVRENGDEKNDGTWLDQVWFGGWDWPQNCDSQYPIDTTLLFLRELLSDIRNFLPAPEVVMEKSEWRRVRLSSGSPSPPPAQIPDSPLFVDQTDGDVPMDLDIPSPDQTHQNHPTSPSSFGGEEDDATDPDTRIIFHPPRGTDNDAKRPVPFRSKCVNRLYEEARLARARAAAARDGRGPPTHMTYRFPPTMEWYAEQKAEGRGYAHVNVDSWERVFNLLKIGGGAAAGGSGSGKGGEDASGGKREGGRERESTVGSG